MKDNYNYIFEECAMQDICYDCKCKLDCSEFDENCPLFEQISELKIKCDELNDTIANLALDAKKLSPDDWGNSNFDPEAVQTDTDVKSRLEELSYKRFYQNNNNVSNF